MDTMVYVDGFNLYYRLLKGNVGTKWLNIETLVRRHLSSSANLIGIRYYTARVKAVPDAQAPQRQQQYLNALRSLPLLECVYGKFLVSEKWARLTEPPKFYPEYELDTPYPVSARVRKTEEKGSDVNLAAHLVRDAYLKKFDEAVIVTNDTDLLEPMRIVIEEVGKPVGLFTPVSQPAQSLKDQASFIRHMTAADARACQFPKMVSFGNKGKHALRPPDWV